ncbi:MAG TPA: tRNA dihydrouridine(16) synthase DusC, partial [Halieaceae bacterium]|nr:tRNA dihydrouridine(16) synthase DusC [Halieaceae bacterium]
MRLILAPMEGVIDAGMRALLTQIGGLDRCVTEFVRVSDRLLPPRVFHRLCPELREGGLTPAGVP